MRKTWGLCSLGMCNSGITGTWEPEEAQLSRLVFVCGCCLVENRDNWMVSKRGLGSEAVTVREESWGSGPGPLKDSQALTSHDDYRHDASLPRMSSYPSSTRKSLLLCEKRHWHKLKFPRLPAGPGAASSVSSDCRAYQQ